MSLRSVLGAVLVGALALGGTVRAAGDLRLVEAIKTQSGQHVRTLLKAGVDVNAAESDGATALHWAAHWNDVETTKALIRAGAKVNTKNDLGATPLWVASVQANPALVEALLDGGADPSIALPNGEVPLMTAARAGVLETVKALVAHGADVNAKEHLRDQTALMWAASQGHADVVQFLLSKGANVRAQSRVRPVLIYVGGRNANLIVDPKLLPLEPRGGFTPLLFAARTGDVDTAKVLLAGGANVNDTAPTGVSALVTAIFSGHTELALFLIEGGADLNAAEAGYSALHVALMRDNERAVKSLLDHGADPNAVIRRSSPSRRDPSGTGDFTIDYAWIGGSPYWLAATLRQPGSMRLLAAKGANTRFAAEVPERIVCSEYGVQGPLGCAQAAPGGSTALIGAVSAPSTSNYASRTVTGDLHERPSLEEVVRTALDLGADVDAADETGNTALHYAVQSNDNKVIELLADRGASLNIRNKQGHTPLRLALGVSDPKREAMGMGAAKVNQATVELLRKRGAQE